MENFGSGPTLKEAVPHLRDDKSRIERILTITEINSVAEGLPPFEEKTRARIRRALTAPSEPDPKPE